MTGSVRKTSLKKCKECGGQFRALRITAEFCGERCRQRHHRQRTLTIPGMADEPTVTIDQWLAGKAKKKTKKKTVTKKAAPTKPRKGM